MDELKKRIKAQISTVLGKAGIAHSDADVEQIIHATNVFKKNGYEISYGRVAEFVANPENRDIIDDHGLQKVLKSLPYMKLGTITGKVKIGRNEPCACGSGVKYKKCCLNK